MKNKVKLLAIAFTIIVFNAQGQDYILKLNIGINNQFCKNISIENDTVNYITVADTAETVTSIDDVYGIHFYENKPHELLLLSFQIDTIVSVIDSISDTEIYYRDKNRLLHSIGINDVFCILFEKGISTPEIESFYNQFIILKKQNYNNSPYLIKKDGTKKDISKFISMTNDTIDIEIGNKRRTTNTFASIYSLSSYINKEPADRQMEVRFKEFVLSKEDILNEVEINWISTNKLDYRLLENRKKINLEQNKKSIAGIFFHDYITKEIPIIEEEPPVEEEPTVKKEPSDSKITFDLSTGYGYMLNLDKTFAIPEENDSYLNKLRSGFTIDANLKMFITKGFGVGVKFNHFYTSNNVQDIISEEITVKFLGGTLFGNLPVMRNKGIFNVDVSLGLLTKKESFEIYKQPHNLNGHTFGYYVSAGLDYFIMRKITIGFSLGLLGGNLERIDINSTYDIILDEPHSLSRFDSMIKIKAYL